MEPPLVSIGLPTYNRATTLRRCVESVIAQDFRAWELIISDNASTDETEALCGEFCGRDSRIRYVRQTENQGATNNFISVFQQARSEYFMWLADDDWPDDNFLSECVAVLQEEPDCVLVYGKAKYFQGEKLASRSEGLSLDQDDPCERVLAYYAGVNDNAAMYGLMRRGLAGNGLLPRNVVGGDWLFMASIAFQGRFRALETTSLNRSLGGTSDSFTKTAATLGLSRLQAYHPYFCIAHFAFQEIGKASPVYGSLGAKARRRLARKTAALILRRFVGRYYFQTFVNAVSFRVKRLAPKWFHEALQSCYRGAYRLLRSLYRRIRPVN